MEEVRVLLNESLQRTLAFALVMLAASTPCISDSRFWSDDPAKTPGSVPIEEIQARINGDESADGIVLSIETRDSIMRVGMKEIPGETSVAAVLRVIMMIGRLAEPRYEEMRFTDEGVDVLAIDGDTIRDIGSQFVWGEEGKGQNPIHLMRLFVDVLPAKDDVAIGRSGNLPCRKCQ